MASVLLFMAGPVHAHGSEPKNTKSEIIAASPNVSGVDFEVVGGDTYLVAVVSKGHTLEVPGYWGEPYLRVSDIGKVEENLSSPTVGLNSTRYGTVGDTSIGAGTKPRWHTLSNNGRAVWHDHRIHWMSTSTPVTIDQTGTIQRWTVPVVINGTNVSITGRLVLLPEPSVMWWLLLIPAIGMAWPLRNGRVVLLLLIVAATVVGVIDISRMLALPEQARHLPTMALVAGVVIALSMAALLIRKEMFTTAISAGAGTAAFLAIVIGSPWMTNSIIPGLSTEWVARVAVPTLAGTGIVMVVAGAMRVLAFSRQ